MSVLWVPTRVIVERQVEEAKAQYEAHQRRSQSAKKTPLDIACDSLALLIEQGNAEAARDAARSLASEVYKTRLDRHFCRETGNAFFYDTDETWDD